MGQYGRFLFVIIDGRRFTEKSAPPVANTTVFPDLLSVHDGVGTGKGDEVLPGGIPGQPPARPEKNPGQPPCLMGEGVDRQSPSLSGRIQSTLIIFG